MTKIKLENLIGKIVEVSWVDAITYSQEKTEEVLKKRLCNKITIGRLIYCDDECIILSHEECVLDKCIDATVIPISWQSKIKKI